MRYEAGNLTEVWRSYATRFQLISSNFDCTELAILYLKVPKIKVLNRFFDGPGREGTGSDRAEGDRTGPEKGYKLQRANNYFSPNGQKTTGLNASLSILIE